MDQKNGNASFLSSPCQGGARGGLLDSALKQIAKTNKPPPAPPWQEGGKKYLKPKSLKEALELLKGKGASYRILAGGTDLIVQMRDSKPSGIIDISSLDELSYIKNADRYIEIGTLATHSMIVNSVILKKHLPSLVYACSLIGAVQIQNRGTIGGNIANASPAGDLPPVLAVLDATVELKSVDGIRLVKIADLFTGYKKIDRRDGELITGFKILKPSKNSIMKFYKVGTRCAQSISKIALAVGMEIDRGQILDAKIAAASMGPTVVRAYRTEEILKGKKISQDLISMAKDQISKEFRPIDDIRSTSSYRRGICSNLLAKYFREIGFS